MSGAVQLEINSNLIQKAILNSLSLKFDFVL